MPDLTNVIDRLRTRLHHETEAARIIEEYAFERASPLLHALERIKTHGTTDIGTPTTWEGKIARDAISAWNERK